MRRIFAVILALVIAMSAAVGTFADDSADTGLDEEQSFEIDITHDEPRAYADNSAGYRTVAVGEILTVNAMSHSGLAITSYAWATDGSSAYKIVSDDRYSCTIEGLKDSNGYVELYFVYTCTSAYGSGSGKDVYKIWVGANSPNTRCGLNAYYSYNERTQEMTIYGTGNMYDYEHHSLPVSASPFYHNTSMRSLIVKDGVTSIGNDTFMSCSALTTVTLPQSVTSIGKYAFDGCKKLETVNLSEGLTVIGRFAFQYCESLKEIIIPNSVKTIEDQAFLKCNLKNIILSENLISIGKSAFTANPFEDIILPESLTSISDAAFCSCAKLKKVVIPKSVTKIGKNAFGSAALYGKSYNQSIYFMGDAPDVTEGNPFDESDVLYYIPGTAGWIDSENYDPETKTWFGCKLLSWDGVSGHQHMAENADAWETDEASHWQVCDECEEIFNESEHNGVRRGEIKATCTEDGLSGDLVCDACGVKLEDGKTLPAEGHNIVNCVCTVCGFTEHTPAAKRSGVKKETCTEDGYTGDIICDVCGEKLDTGAVIPASGHEFVKCVCKVCGFTEHTPAAKRSGVKKETCTEDGYTGDILCDVCGAKLEEGKPIPAPGHKWVNNNCSVCGTAKFAVGDLNGDGLVNITDAIELLKYVAKLDNNVVNKAGTDIDGNGTVNINDAITLLKLIAGLV